MKLKCSKCKKEFDTDEYEVGRLALRAEHSYTGGEDDCCNNVWFYCETSLGGCGYQEHLGCAIIPDD